jgi:hypothetical protein
MSCLKRECIQKHSSNHSRMAHNDLVIECLGTDLAHKESGQQNPLGSIYRSRILGQRKHQKFHTDSIYQRDSPRRP